MNTRGLGRLLWTELKLYLREPLAALFTLAFPSLMLLLFGSIYGNEPSPFFGGLGSVDVSVPGYTALMIATTGIMYLVNVNVSYRERGVLRRLRATPLPPLCLLLAQVGVVFMVTVIGMTALVVLARSLYGLRFFGNVTHVVAGFVLSAVSFYALGFVLAGFLPTIRTAQATTQVLFQVMIFLSGALIPREILPPRVQQAAQVLPLTHVVNLLRGLWLGGSLGQYGRELGILTVMFLVGVGVTVSGRTFRWE
ncbi:MAG: ABC transporter permease [Bacillota bacterium]